MVMKTIYIAVITAVLISMTPSRQMTAAAGDDGAAREITEAAKETGKEIKKTGKENARAAKEAVSKKSLKKAEKEIKDAAVETGKEIKKGVKEVMEGDRKK
ncbi:MAG: hypothetical protein HY894_09380 [Deltaproteobacteria bacterium]|nr:hypothetical protein [Deltaproteobacteria bacterium]